MAQLLLQRLACAMGVAYIQKIPSADNFHVAHPHVAALEHVGKLESLIVATHSGARHSLGEQFLVGQRVQRVNGRPAAGRQPMQFPLEQFGDFLGGFSVLLAKNLTRPYLMSYSEARLSEQKRKLTTEIRHKIPRFQFVGNARITPEVRMCIKFQLLQHAFRTTERHFATAICCISKM
ncbi:hypothetical protein [Nitratidesulfovibrio sp. 1201_IL3209]|uniref:hypothetical protein n=1 Tax=Nitratidesulfovibrio sp. 1201_IL3209 TaxID=3084053 RepID=UPI002FD9EB37